MSFLQCQYAKICSGCPEILKTSSEQISQKQESLLEQIPFAKLNEVQILRPAEKAFRDKVDLTIEEGKIGFYSHIDRAIFDLKECPLLTSSLNKVFAEFRNHLPKIKKGSVRLRVAPNRLKGLWLDFANIDIKNLLDTKNDLLELTKIFDVIEIGQKAKVLSVFQNETKIAYKDIPKEGREAFTLKLTEPERHPWFETYIFTENEFQKIPVEMHINSFSQTGTQTNEALIKIFSEYIQKTQSKTVLELCAGSGNLTFPLLNLVEKVTTVEMNSQAVEALTTSAKKMNLENNLKVDVGNIHKPTELKGLCESNALLVVDPPRSGLGAFLETLKAIEINNRPENIIYISCHTDSFAQDLKHLYDLNYKISDIQGIDQFPHTKHCEWIALLKKQH